jgi:hypothetical protein
MELKIDGPRLGAALFQKVIMKWRVGNMDSLCITDAKNISQARDWLARGSVLG